MIILRSPGSEPLDNDDSPPQSLLDEMIEAFKGPIPPTAEDLDAGTRFATGGWVTTGFLYDPETECEVITPKNVGHGILFKPDPMEEPEKVRSVTTYESIADWKPLGTLIARSVSQTFPMIPSKGFAKFMFFRPLGIYRLPGDKPLIHKGKKP